MPKELIVELPEKTKVTKVKYADAPNGTPYEITVEELKEKAHQHFTYSDALFSKGKHPPYYKEGHKANNDYTFKRFQQFGFADTSSFVICNMGSIGHGVFADRDFEPAECFILYAGIILDKSQEKGDSIYGFSYNPKYKLFVDAAEIGNISRFVQHMPNNFELFSQYRRDKLNHSKEQIHKDKGSADYWQWRNLVYKSDLTKADVAWANLTMMVVRIKDIPCIVFYNTQKINKGTQLGISYGCYYWFGRNLQPELFDLKGGIIPTAKCGYREVLIQLPLMGLFNKLSMFQNNHIEKSYNATIFKKDLERVEETVNPVWFSHLAEPVSIFKLRELLLQYNAIEKGFEQVENEFVVKLRDILPKEFTVKMFERTPHKQLSRRIFDVVCSTDDLMKWAQLTILIKTSVLAQYIQNKCLKFTQEVVLLDINNENKLLLLKMLQMSQAKTIFIKPLPIDLIPDGPDRNDPNTFQQVVADESINQILFHNPGLTKAKIKETYNMLNEVSLPTNFTNNDHIIIQDNNKERKLHNITSSFFKANNSGTWRTYPSESLIGKYIGHQVRFFNFSNENSSKAIPFFDLLKQNGFAAELKQVKDKPSILIDLTTSTL